mmetsp:Transcript_8778/g.13152  ORF Transcript_8778/g.13152 Transcript_8778/m.13152 type:complete len:90 (+) Transcript_8778:1435-1704(+)
MYRVAGDHQHTSTQAHWIEIIYSSTVYPPPSSSSSIVSSRSLFFFAASSLVLCLLTFNFISSSTSTWAKDSVLFEHPGIGHLVFLVLNN